MATTLRTALAILTLFALPAAAMPNPPDCSAASATAGQMFANAGCDCATATSHGAFVSCAAHVVKDLAAHGMIPRSCRGTLLRGVARSTCGRPDAETCCMTRGHKTKCSVKRAGLCAVRGGAVGKTDTCLDACMPASASGAFVD